MSDAASRILVEVCVGSVVDIEAAVAAGAGRVELCGALELGGLTPSIGLVEAALSMSPIPLVVMLRPRAGGFCYDRHEFRAMFHDAQRFLDLGASGIVFGILDDSGQIDVSRCRELIQLARTAQTVFHRGFDFVSDQRAAIDALVNLGATRILSSGGKPTAMDGAATLRELIAYTAGRIEIMPGGGVNAENVVDIVRATRCSQVHIGAAAPTDDGSLNSTANVELCDRRFLQGHAHRVVDRGSVANAVGALRTAAFEF